MQVPFVLKKLPSLFFSCFVCCCAGKTTLLLSSKTGDLLLELEAADANVRDAWVR